MDKCNRKQKIVTLAWMVVPHLSKQSSFQSFHQENAHAEASPDYYEVIRVPERHTPHHSYTHTGESVPGIRYNVEQWGFTTAKGDQCCL